MGNDNLRIIVSGGGTGGHIFPAVSIANAIKELHPDTEILFVGALGRMEMQRVPAAGYDIVGLPVAGFDRKHLLKNIGVLVKLFRSQRMARKIIKDFKPHAAVGVGGYASGPTLKMAEAMGIPTLIQEQNSYAGVTNKLLAKKADKICVAYEGMERFFPAEKIIVTGNPVRQSILNCPLTRQEARERFGLEPDKKTVLVVGGSLGARTINRSIEKGIDSIAASGIQMIWQTGKFYDEEAKAVMADKKPANIKQTAFVANMDEAYRAADLVVSRAGASSISELQLLGKAAILVPSPNVAEDHQTKNAMALVNNAAAVMVTDANAPETLVETLINIVNDDTKLKTLSENIKKMALLDSVDKIVDKVMELIKR